MFSAKLTENTVLNATKEGTKYRSFTSPTRLSRCKLTVFDSSRYQNCNQSAQKVSKIQISWKNADLKSLNLKKFIVRLHRRRLMKTVHVVFYNRDILERRNTVCRKTEKSRNWKITDKFWRKRRRSCRSICCRKVGRRELEVVAYWITQSCWIAWCKSFCQQSHVTGP